MGTSLLLVGLIVAIRVADLSVDVILLIEHVVADAFGVGVLQIGVEIDFDDAVTDGIQVVLLAGAGAAMEDEEDGLFILALLLLLHILLMLAEELGAQLDVAGLVHAMHVAEARSDGEVGRDGRERLVDVVDVFGLSVQAVVVYRLIVDTVLFTSRDADFHLKPLLHGRGALEICGSGLDVLIDCLFRQIDHVARI